MATKKEREEKKIFWVRKKTFEYSMNEIERSGKRGEKE
jgi:hypothetical protein